MQQLHNLLLAPLYLLERKLTFKPTQGDYGGLPEGAEQITFGKEFGFTLDGRFVKGTSKYTVLFLHGNRYNLTKFKSQYDFFTSSQLSFFTFDYPGYGESEGVPSESALYASARAAYSYLMYERGVSPHNLIVYGLSLGAALATELLTTQSAAKFIAECPFTNTWAMAQHLYSFLPVWWGLPNRFRNDVKFPALQLPVFLFHGSEDRVTPWSCSQQLFDSISGPKVFTLVNGAGHNNCLEVGAEQLQKRLREWIEATP